MVDLIFDPRTPPAPAPSPEQGPADVLQALAAPGSFTGWQGGGAGDAAQVGDEAVEMAITWLGLMQHDSVSVPALQCATAGLAATVLLCAVPG